MRPQSSWDIDKASQYHFHEWDDGVVLFLEGEGSTFLLSSFSAYVLKLLFEGKKNAQELVSQILIEYPDEPVKALTNAVNAAMVEMRRRGIVVRIRQ